MSSHIPRKRFGQNFLTDSSVIFDILQAMAPQRDDKVVEIGPGLGALTEPLLAAVDHLSVVELDRDLASRLAQRFPPARLTIHQADALQFDFASLGTGLRLIGNLPYNISSPLLFHLASAAESVHDMHFMLQKEVVDRMLASPGSPDYGKLSVMLQCRFYMEHVLDVPPTAFYPPPKVNSAVVYLSPLPQAQQWDVDLSQLEKTVAQAFAQRRKTLRNNFKGVMDDEAFDSLGIDPAARAETLDLDAFVTLSNHLARGAG
jgi:16S rRNA (adenine1518-N6/adenine1519-N6)-dimethyltransferase